MLRRLVPVAVFLLCSVGGALAEAAFVFTFADTGGSPQSSFEINGVAGTVDVRVYLTDTDGAGGLLASDGLGSIDFDVNEETTTPDRFHVSAVDVNSEFDFDAAFDLDLLDDSTALRLFSLLGTTPASSIYLATLTFTGDSAGVADIQATNASNVTTTLGDRISVEPASARITVTSAQSEIPEPATLLLFAGLLGTAGLGVLRRQRRKAA